MKKVLVTGGAGFVGRHICKALLERGDQVICVDSIVPLTGGICPIENKGWPLYDPFGYVNFKYFRQDCREYFKACRDTDFDEVYHLAAMVGGREMIELNPLAVAEDLSIDSEFWQWAKFTKPKKSVCFSSSAAYPVKFQRKDGYVLLKENMVDFGDDIGFPDLSYGWAKLTHEYLARIAHDKYGVNSVTYRPFSGYGEDQDLAYPFPSICKRAIESKGQSKFTVWGTGDQMRDFIHIDDCVRGILHTMYKIDDGKPINLSTGILTSFKSFARTATGLLGYSPEVEGTSTKPEGVFARGGCTELQAKMGFSASIPFEHGVKRGLEYAEKMLGKK